MVSWLPVFFPCAHMTFYISTVKKRTCVQPRPQSDQSAAADEVRTLPRDAISASLWALDQLYVPAMHLGKRRE